MSNELLEFDVIAEALIEKAQKDGAETMWDRKSVVLTETPSSPETLRECAVAVHPPTLTMRVISYMQCIILLKMVLSKSEKKAS